METTKKLVMTFANEDGGRVSISIEDPKEEILEAEIKDAMDLIVSKDIFAPNGLSLVTALEARVVVTDTTPYDLVIG